MIIALCVVGYLIVGIGVAALCSLNNCAGMKYVDIDRHYVEVESAQKLVISIWPFVVVWVGAKAFFDGLVWIVERIVP